MAKLITHMDSHHGLCRKAVRSAHSHLLVSRGSQMIKHVGLLRQNAL